MAHFWVVGGEYTNTDFMTIAPGKSLQELGPFSTYEEAHQVWATRAWATVDDCNARYRVVEGTAEAPGQGRPLVEGAGPLKSA